MVDSEPILLARVLRERRLARYGSFCRAYEQAARGVGAVTLAPPSRAQFHRWVTGDLKRLPYTDHCRVLEGMFPEWTAEELFSPAGASARSPAGDTEEGVVLEPTTDGGTRAGVVAAYTSRAEFASATPSHTLFEGARRVQAAGLSLNVICRRWSRRAACPDLC